MKRALWSICLALALIVAGCRPIPGQSYGEIREEIWLAPLDVWQVKIIWVLNPSERASVFAEIDSHVGQRCQSANVQGLYCRLRHQDTLEGGVVTTITVVGRGLGELNLAAFDGQALLTRDESGHIILKASPPVRQLRYYGLTLHTGPIIESNAGRQTLFTAIWENPDSLWIRSWSLNPAGLILAAFIVYPIYAWAGAIVLMALLVLALRRRRRRWR